MKKAFGILTVVMVFCLCAKDVKFSGMVKLPSGVELEMIEIKAGSFVMGSPDGEVGRDDDETQHRVTLTKKYWLGKYEVTQGQWQAVMGTNPSSHKKGDKYPVESVSWHDVKQFCDKLNKLYERKLPQGYRFDLPTEAQWEYACRAGTTTALNNGKGLTAQRGVCPNLNEVGWYDENSSQAPLPVGKKHPNAWGLYDMHGNVWEWCRDWADGYHGDVIDPVGPESGSIRIRRGGGWRVSSKQCRSEWRGSSEPSVRDENLGFRLALVSFPSNVVVGENPGSRSALAPSSRSVAAELQIIRKAAEQGNANAQNLLGLGYYIGQGIEKNFCEAFKWFRKAAEQGNAEAQYNLGVCYRSGEGVAQNYGEAFKWFRKSAEQGYAKAQGMLGLFYAQGEIVKRDDFEALKWIRKAAEQGEAGAQLILGVWYQEDGRGGVRQDYVEAVKWLRRSAEQGNAIAQFNLGLCYDTGRGVRQDDSEAFKWYLQAAKQNHTEAQFQVACSYGVGKGVVRYDSEAVKWFLLVAVKGDSKAQCALGIAYAEGRGVERDMAEAVNWLRLSARQGNSTAIGILRSILRSTNR